MEPGNPWENEYIKSFDEKFRYEIFDNILKSNILTLFMH